MDGKELVITLWNGDKLTLPFVGGKYHYKTVMNHVKLLLREERLFKEDVKQG